MINETWVKLYRGMMDTSFYKNPNTCHLAMHLILAVNHQENRIVFNGQEITIRAGEIITGRKKLSEETGLTERQVRTSLQTLTNVGFLTIKTTNRFSTIYLNKYQQYQNKTTSTLTNKRPANDQQTTTNNNDKKEKNDNNNLFVTEAEEVQTHYNTVFGSSYHSVKPWLKNFIGWRETYSVAEIKQAITISKNDVWWRDHGGMTLIILFRTKDTKGENCDRIGNFLSRATQGIPKYILDQRRLNNEQLN